MKCLYKVAVYLIVLLLFVCTLINTLVVTSDAVKDNHDFLNRYITDFLTHPKIVDNLHVNDTVNNQQRIKCQVIFVDSYQLCKSLELLARDKKSSLSPFISSSSTNSTMVFGRQTSAFTTHTPSSWLFLLSTAQNKVDSIDSSNSKRSVSTIDNATPTITSVTSLYGIILQHSNDPTSPLYPLLNNLHHPKSQSDKTIIKSRSALKAKQEDQEEAVKSPYSAKKDPFFASFIDPLTTSESSSLLPFHNNKSAKNITSVYLPEFVLFGTLVSALHKPSKHYPMAMSPMNFARLLTYMDTTDCDVIPISSDSLHSSRAGSQTTSQSLKATLGQYGIKAWMALLKAMGTIPSDLMLKSLETNVFAHHHSPIHPYITPSAESISLSSASQADKNAQQRLREEWQVQHSRRMINYPHLYPIMDIPPSEPFQLFALRPSLLVPLAHFMVDAENTLLHDNTWNIQAMFYEQENMKIQIFERLPAFFLTHVLKAHVCPPFQSTYSHGKRSPHRNKKHAITEEGPDNSAELVVQ